MPAEMIEQGSDAWWQMKMGKISASHINDIMAVDKSGKPRASRKNYVAKLALERITGKRDETGYHSHSMDQGVEREKFAIGLYEVVRESMVIPVAFVDHPSLPMTGASPDGLINSDGGIEVKCPEPAQHLAFIRTGKIDTKYLQQMQWGMECTGRSWWTFMSYNPDFPENARAWIFRVDRDDAEIRGITKEIMVAEQEIQDAVDLVSKYELA